MSILTVSNNTVKQSSLDVDASEVAQAQPNRKVKAIKTEVYSRVVGYYRPVQDWHEGKKEEFRQRETHSPEEISQSAKYPFPCPLMDKQEA